MPTKTSVTTLCWACRAACRHHSILQFPRRHAVILSRYYHSNHPRPSHCSSSDSSNGSGSGSIGKNVTSLPRSYATASSRSLPGDTEANKLPAWPRNANPTPYEILGMDPGAVYTKRRFHQLVKLYHPDMSASAVSKLSQATRTERYRLVVAANDLLSDPEKRRRYDQHGVGWSYGRAPSLRERDRDWRTRSNSAAHNASWEDWEVWRQRAEQQRRRHDAGGGGSGGGGSGTEPDFDRAHDSMVLTMIVIVCIVAALMQSKRAHDRSTEIDRALREALPTSAAQAGVNMTREEQIEAFLRQRENNTYRYGPRKYEEQGSMERKGPER